jgi:hypothetical protein
MKRTKTILLATIMLVALSASAQRFEVFGEYSYLHFSPTLSGLQSRSFNGGGGGAQINFLKILAIKADLMDYASTDFTVHYNTPVHLPTGGTIPAGTFTSKGDMFTFLFGPVLIIPIPKVKPFGEVLMGGSKTNAYVNLSNAIDQAGGTVAVATQHPFTMALGGGLDVDAGKHIGLRLAEFDYVLSRYSNPLTSTGNQNNFRYCGGIILKF